MAALLNGTAWEKVLDEIEQALARVELEAAQREQELNAERVDEGPDAIEAWQKRLAQWDERVEGLDVFARQAEQKVAETSAALREGEEALRSWLAASQEARLKLTGNQSPLRVSAAE